MSFIQHSGKPPPLPNKCAWVANVVVSSHSNKMDKKTEQTGPPPLPNRERELDIARKAGIEFAEFINEIRIANNQPKIPVCVL